jgi:sugar lactone lactonase YvrE
MRTILASILLAAAVVGPAAASPAVETIKLFDPSLGETPESIQFDRRGNFVVSLALTGEVRRIGRDGSEQTLAFVPLRPDLQPCGNAFGLPIMGALALDPHDNVYVAVAPCDPGAIGLYRIPAAGGAPVRIAALPADALPNGVAYRAGWLYVADSNRGAVWRIAADGSSTSVWTADPLLAPLPDFFPGPNGLQIFHDEVYVAVSDRAHVVAFPIQADGSAGPGRIHTSGIGLDDFAFDVEGNLYGTTDPFNTVVRVAPDGSQQVLLTAADGLDGPTSCAFGVHGGDRKTLYVNNAAFPFFSTTHRPSILGVDIGIPGKPR